MADITDLKTTLPPLIPPNRLLRWPEVRDRVGFCRSQAYKLIDKGKFPKPIALVEGGRSIAWIEIEIQEWIDQRIADTRPTDPEST